MKVKKAIRRLDKIESILSDVIDQYSPNGSGTREFLDAARVSIIRAKAKVHKELEPASRKDGASSKADKRKRSGNKAKEIKTLPKKLSGVKRKDVHTETAPAVSGTQQGDSKTA